MFRVNNLILKTIFEDIYTELKIDAKVSILKKYLLKEYPYDNSTIAGGGVFIREYSKIKNK